MPKRTMQYPVYPHTIHNKSLSVCVDLRPKKISIITKIVRVAEFEQKEKDLDSSKTSSLSLSSSCSNESDDSDLLKMVKSIQTDVKDFCEKNGTKIFDLFNEKEKLKNQIFYLQKVCFSIFFVAIAINCPEKSVQSPKMFPLFTEWSPKVQCSFLFLFFGVHFLRERISSLKNFGY